MRKLGLLGSSALRSAVFIGAIAVAAPAMAQDQDSTTALQSEAEIESGQDASGQTITVTGSRIRRPNLESTVPVTSIGGEEFFETGQVSVGDVLNELPALRSTFSQSNSTRFLGTAGLNLLDLRGLGTQRTLVLVNGRRHVGSDILSNAVTPDVNTFPTDLIERVDVVTGGNSAIYGSDAIAGVVNFILKKDFEGIQVRGQGGVSKYGDAGSYYASALLGTNFAEGRGNVALNLEYARQEDFYASGRPNLRNNQGFVVVDTDPAGSDGNPDRQFFRDIRFATLSIGGQVGFASPTGACGRDALGAAYTCAFVFNPDGSLTPQTGTRVGLAPNGNFIGGNGINNRERNSLGILPQLDRYSANLIAHFTISDALEPFVEAKYVRTDSLGSASGPAFFQGSTIDANRERPRLDNPFLTDQARNLITQQLLIVNPAATITGATRFQLRKNLLDLGDREETARRETYRIVGGIRGEFNDDWGYEVSANYGEFKEATTVRGNLNQQRFVLAMDSVRDPATGNIVCRSQIDPAAARIFPFANSDAAAEARLGADVAACVPLNPFGEGNITPAMSNYVIQDTVSRGKISQFVLNAFLSGDSSQLFELPAGPVGFALGAEYRRETAFFKADDLVAAGLTFYNALPLFDPPAFEVKELFGEIRVPILSEVPFFHELTVSGAGRVADYNGATGTVFAYNGGVDWAPIQDLRLRANYSRAVRAPNLSDLFSEQSQNFAPGFSDPCSARNIGAGSENRARNCEAAGRPAGYDYVYVQSLQILSGGNPALNEETSDSWTIGGVFQPRFLPGFSLSVDYFNITVNDVITAPTAQQIVNACYDSSDLNNQFCDLFERNPNAALGPFDEEQFRILEGTLQQTLLNYAKLKTRGIDVEAAYRRNIEGFGNLSTRFTYTHMLQNDTFLDPTDPGRANQFLMELGDPRDSFNWNIDLKTGPVTLGYQMRYLSKMVTNFYEDFFSKQGRPAENEDWSAFKFYPAVTYHDVRMGIDATKNFNFYVGVDNVFNRLPPFGLTGVGGGSGIYEPRGRFFYAGAKAKF
jgi:outer membrane receptor protein involved in Fe transport